MSDPAKPKDASYYKKKADRKYRETCDCARPATRPGCTGGYWVCEWCDRIERAGMVPKNHAGPKLPSKQP